MAKKAKKARKTGSAKGAKRKQRVWTKEKIFDDWRDAAEDGLGDGKKFDDAIFGEFRDRLLAKIQERLDNNDDYNEDRANTRRVAKDLGKICRIFTRKTVPLGLFENIFELCKFHPKCPGSGGPGSGVWCDI